MDIENEVAIIGGGAAGLSAARLLTKHGLSCGATDPAHALREPCADTLFFAGDALDLSYPATVAGALGSGEHAARKLLAACR